MDTDWKSKPPMVTTHTLEQIESLAIGSCTNCSQLQILHTVHLHDVHLNTHWVGCSEMIFADLVQSTWERPAIGQTPICLCFDLK